MTYTYPGVYIDEIPSGVHAITGVSTSNTAFVDFFSRGPLDQAIEITSYGDFERIFGGLDERSEASYAILQYYLNGGQIAFVVRVASGAKQAWGWLGAGYTGQPTLQVMAANEGVWGNNIQVAVGAVDPKYTKVDPTLFNLVVREAVPTDGGVVIKSTETYLSLSLSLASPRYAPNVVKNSSNLIRLNDAGIGQPPAATGGDPIGKPNGSGTVWTNLTSLSNPQAGSDGVAPLAPGSVATSTWATNEGRTVITGDPASHTGMYALDLIEPAIFNILCIPAAAALADTKPEDPLSSLYGDAASYCESKRAFLIVDIPASVDRPAKMVTWMSDPSGANPHDGLRNTNSAIYFPRLLMGDPLNPSQPRNVGASGTLAGVYARIDSTRGVWKAPAGIEAFLNKVDVAVRLTDLENGELNPLGINVLRNFPVYGQVSWGARTLEGADQVASEWKYIPVRRLALFIEESLYDGTKWAVFEPNDEPLWAQLRMNVGTFMQDLFRREAFQGSTPDQAYFVKCDKDTTTSSDQDLGVVNVVVGFAPLKPAEFVVIRIQQLAGQSAS